MDFRNLVPGLEEQVAEKISSNIITIYFCSGIITHSMNSEIGLDVCSEVEKAVKLSFKPLILRKNPIKLQLIC